MNTCRRVPVPLTRRLSLSLSLSLPLPLPLPLRLSLPLPLPRPVPLLLLAALLLGASLPAAHAQSRTGAQAVPGNQAAPGPQDADRIEKVSVRAVAHFDFDSTALKPQDRQHLLAEVAGMKDVSWQAVTATGHTDSVGRPAYNAALAARRAQAVKRYLTGQGLPPALVRVAAAGEAQPLADNGSDDGRARNRRTEVVFEGVRTASR